MAKAAKDHPAASGYVISPLYSAEAISISYVILLLYSAAAISISSICLAALATEVPGPNIAATPAS